MNYLVDANVLSEPTKPRPNKVVLEWLSRHEADLVVDPIVLGEILTGILSLPRGRRRTDLQAWFDEVAEQTECLPWDMRVGLRWSRLVTDLRAQGKAMPLLDSMIAATALTHGLTVATHNVRDFRNAGAMVHDPFE